MRTLKWFCLGIMIIGVTCGYGCRSTDDGSSGGEPIPKAEPGPGAAGMGGVEIEDVPGDFTLEEDVLAGGEGWSEKGQPIAPRPGEWRPIPGLKFPTIYFAYDQSRVGTSQQKKLEVVADYMQKHKTIGLIIEGHCDQRGSAEYNRALGERRAMAVRDYLTSLGVADNRFKTISYGEERPAVEGDNPTAFAKNRRAELVPARTR